jgi:hypothetical protein
MTIFALIDTASQNVLGEFGSREEAEALRSRLVAADASAGAHLRIETDDDADAPETPRKIAFQR